MTTTAEMSKPTEQPSFSRQVVCIVLAVVFLHGLVFWIGRHGWPSSTPKKSEITIELGSPVALHSNAGVENDGSAVSPHTHEDIRPNQKPDSQLVKSESVSKSADRDELASMPVNESSGTAAAKTPPQPEEPKLETAPVEPVKSQAAAAVDIPASVDADYKAAFLNNPKPPYPPLVFQMRIEGTVLLKALVLPDGTCGEVVLARSSGNELLDKSALTTVAQWKFTPAKTRGKETSQWVGIPITFSLKRR